VGTNRYCRFSGAASLHPGRRHAFLAGQIVQESSPIGWPRHITNGPGLVVGIIGPVNRRRSEAQELLSGCGERPQLTPSGRCAFPHRRVASPKRQR